MTPAEMRVVPVELITTNENGVREVWLQVPKSAGTQLEYGGHHWKLWKVVPDAGNEEEQS